MMYCNASKFCSMTLLMSLALNACKQPPQRQKFTPAFSTTVTKDEDTELAQLEKERDGIVSYEARLLELYERGMAVENGSKSLDVKSFVTDVANISDDATIQAISKEVSFTSSLGPNDDPMGSMGTPGPAGSPGIPGPMGGPP